MFVKMRAVELILASIFMVILSGCDSGSSGGGGSMSQAGAQLEAEKDAEQQAATQAAEAEAAKQAAASAPQSPAEPARTEAGRAPIGEGGYLVAIGGARRHVLNRVDDLAWTQAVQHFQATEGRLPKDHNEFMTRVIEPEGIPLGYIEEGQEFLYDPQEGQWGTLYVVEKAPAPAP